MDDADRHQQAEMLAGDIVNALDDLECLWAYHGLPGVSQELYDKRLWVRSQVVRMIARQLRTEDLVGLLRALGETLYKRFSKDPE
ncbi:hypothetical protein [Thiocystis violacea]|uniref:hypothetical protein n=1 Tax=Thiocystis violacea TaxID=13725 RepID=UPI00190382F8|nr:hypothetical protein [Thiocystis violacea]MBK1724163.1 hypothetical protein [Thiocystis violacea]